MELFSTPEDSLVKDKDLLMGGWPLLSVLLWASTVELRGLLISQDLFQQLRLWDEEDIFRKTPGEDEGEDMVAERRPSSSCCDRRRVDRGVILELESSVDREARFHQGTNPCR